MSQILEQILNAVGSILMAYLLMNAAADREKSEGLSWGAMGGAIGTGIGVLAALLFMAGVYRLNSGMIKKRIEKDAGHKEESYGAVFKMIILGGHALYSEYLYLQCQHLYQSECVPVDHD